MFYHINRFFGMAGGVLKEINWLLLRVLGSAMFMTHGYDKLFGENTQVFRNGGMMTVNIGEQIMFDMPWALNALFVAGVIELLGGFLILLGLWTHIVAFIAVLLMAMAYAVAHLAWFPTLNGGELAAMYFLVYLVLFSHGPGAISLDRLFERRRDAKQEAPPTGDDSDLPRL
jgi:putative oxidoreductase